MITVHASAVCRVVDGYSGRPVEAAGLLCVLDGRPFRPVSKPGGCLVLVNLADGAHRLSLRGRGFQEEWVSFTAGPGTLELEVTMKPGAGYPFRGPVTRLSLTVLEAGSPAPGRQIWLAAPGRPELKIAQTRAEPGDRAVRIYCKGPEAPALPGTYLIDDGQKSEIVLLRGIREEMGELAAPLSRAHARGRPLLPAQRYHTGPDGTLTAAFRTPCAVEVCGGRGGLLAGLELAEGENTFTIQL